MSMRAIKLPTGSLMPATKKNVPNISGARLSKAVAYRATREIKMKDDHTRRRTETNLWKTNLVAAERNKGLWPTFSAKLQERGVWELAHELWSKKLREWTWSTLGSILACELAEFLNAKGTLAEIRNKWLAAINSRLELDCVMSNVRRYGKKAIWIKLVQSIWKGTLMNEDAPPTRLGEGYWGVSGYSAVSGSPGNKMISK
ncbi:hypothetical protein B0H21DRAFT_705882 [Amylocystis lapponica]|nr:hypothetical protein B0H21DRAFT_705882 [Amylocystis lapponica]